LAAASSVGRERAEGGKVGVASAVGEAVAAVCVTKKITRVVFDRNGYLYHGRVKALADGARKGGLQF
jgi:large subunit ribosomal protein L18